MLLAGTEPLSRPSEASPKGCLDSGSAPALFMLRRAKRPQLAPLSKAIPPIDSATQPHYLAEGGYLAIVVPDGILTNSSLQYVRAEIEDLFRIVAVVSLPQTAFTATGAGVKSSVVFLKKHTARETQRMRDTKQALKDSVRKQEKFDATLDAIERRKREAIEALNTRPEFVKLTPKSRRDDPAYRAAAAELSERIAKVSAII